MNVWIVGVAWQAGEDALAPFGNPFPAGSGIAATGPDWALRDAGLDPLLLSSPAAPSLFVAGQTEGAAYDSLAAALHSALTALQGGGCSVALVGARSNTEPLAACWLVLERQESARLRAIAAYAAIVGTLQSADGADRIGWVEKPSGDKAMRDGWTLIRAALALGHKLLPGGPSRPATDGALPLEPLPWIHPLPLPGRSASAPPRRAGWLATSPPPELPGLLLEEVTSRYARPDPLPWSEELFLLGADSPAALHHELLALRVLLEQPSQESDGQRLTRLAQLCSRQLSPSASYRIALLTGSAAELHKHLTELGAELGAELEQTAPSGSLQLENLHRPKSGIFCGSGARTEGSTAFLFPGLGASYPLMLRDLCLHFPAVREVFDSIDFVAAELGELTPPSQQLFAPATIAVASRLPDDAGAAAAVITLVMTEWALAQLLRELGVVPDVLMGCSTGEFAALCQGGAIDAVNAVPLFYRLSLAVARALPPAKLETLRSLLVAAPVRALQPLLSAAPGPIFVSADLGPDCALLVGEQAAIGWLLGELARHSLTAQPLPVSVPYHTPLVDTAALHSAAELRTLPIATPQMPIWSCATSRPYPMEPAAILEDASALFVRSIALFGTIDAMYTSGVRTFIEVGPGDGLCRRVGAILGQRAHVALPSNVPKRSGLAQLLRLLAALHAQGHPLTLEPLFRRRLPAPPIQVGKPPRDFTSGRLRNPERLGSALPALTLDLPHAERWSCLRIDRSELPKAAWSAPLISQLAAKRALQLLLWRLLRRSISLPEIALHLDPQARLHAQGSWSSELGGEPLIATASCDDAAVALVATADRQARLGIDIQRIPVPTSESRAAPHDNFQTQLAILKLQGAQTAIKRALLLPARPIATESEMVLLAADSQTGWFCLHLAEQPKPLYARAMQLGSHVISTSIEIGIGDWANQPG